MSYYYSGDQVLQIKYKKIREWAESCDQVMSWMQLNFPKEEFDRIFKKAFEFKSGHVYKIENEYYLVSPCIDEKYILVSLSQAETQYGGIDTLEHLSQTYGFKIQEDMGYCNAVVLMTVARRKGAVT